MIVNVYINKISILLNFNNHLNRDDKQQISKLGTIHDFSQEAMPINKVLTLAIMLKNLFDFLLKKVRERIKDRNMFEIYD